MSANDDKIRYFEVEKAKRSAIQETPLYSVSCPWCEETGCFVPLMKRDEHGGPLITGLLCTSAKCQGDHQFIIDNGYLGPSF